MGEMVDLAAAVVVVSGSGVCVRLQMSVYCVGNWGERGERVSFWLVPSCYCNCDAARFTLILTYLQVLEPTKSQRHRARGPPTLQVYGLRV